MESDLDELVATDQLTEDFTKAASHLQSIVARFDQDTLLKLYGFYKQASQGPCNIPKPNFLNVNGRAKWQAWKNLGDLSQDEAKASYIKTVESLDPQFKTSENLKSDWVKVSVMVPDQDEVQFEESLVEYVKNGNVGKVEEHLRNTKSEDLYEVLNALDDNGLGLIHWAADRGYKDVLKVLLDFGADVNLQDEDQQTALHYAASCGNVSCVEELLRRKVDVRIRDSEGASAIEVANDQAVKDLLSNRL